MEDWIEIDKELPPQNVMIDYLDLMGHGGYGKCYTRTRRDLVQDFSDKKMTFVNKWRLRNDSDDSKSTATKQR